MALYTYCCYVAYTVVCSLPVLPVPVPVPVLVLDLHLLCRAINGTVSFSTVTRHNAKADVIDSSTMMELYNYVNGAAVGSASTETTVPVLPRERPRDCAQVERRRCRRSHEGSAKSQSRQTTPLRAQTMLLKIADAFDANKELIANAECKNCGKPKQLFLDEELAVMCDQIGFFVGMRVFEGRRHVHEGHVFVRHQEPVGVCE